MERPRTMDSSDLRTLRVATRHFNNLRGLVFLPLGLAYLATQFTGPYADLWIWLVGIALMWAATDYYRRLYGVVRRSPDQVRREAWSMVLFLIAFVGAILPFRWDLYPPVDLVLVVLGSALLIGWATQFSAVPGLEHHLVIGLLVLALSMTPSALSSPASYYHSIHQELLAVVLSWTLIVIGVLDHLFLSRAMSRLRDAQHTLMERS